MSATAVDRCNGCPYSNQPCVGTYGPVDSPFAIVGEAPGAQEVKEGRPFIGPSGKLLQRITDQIGLPLDECFITNTLRCRLPADTQISTEAIKACNSRLVSELTEYDRKVVVTLGASPLKALSNINASILNVRGQRFQHSTGLTVLPTIHPAFVLRQGTALPKLREDLRQALWIWKGGGYDRGETRYAVIEDDDEVVLTVKGLMLQEYLALDIESATLTIGDHILAIGIAWDKNKVLIYPWEVIERHHQLFQQLFTSDVKWIFHNAQFDTSRLQARGFDIQTSEDTFLLYGLLDETAKSASLKDLAATELGASEWTSEIDVWLGRTTSRSKARISFQVIPRTALHKYLAQDSDNTLQLWPILRERVKRDKGLDRVYRKLLIPASNFLREVEMYGMWIDPDETEKLRVETVERLRVLRERLLGLANEITHGAIANHNPNSVRQVKQIIYGYLNLQPLPEERKYFAGTTQRTDLERLEPHPYVEALLVYRRIVKVFGTYVNRFPKLRSVDGRIHTSYNLNGTKTGRLSSRPNLQNITRTLDEERNPDWVNAKRMFAAPPGRVLIECDFSQAELRLLAAVSKDPFLIDVYANDRDLHSEVAKQLFGDDYSKEDRDIAKRINFGVIYGLMAANLARIFKMSISEAQAIIDRWYGLVPVAREYLMSNANHVNVGKPIRSPLGRLRRWGLITRDMIVKLRNEAMNAPIQSGASDFTLLSGIRVQPQLREWDASVINLVHDSLVIESLAEEQTVNRIIHYVTSTMEQVPLEVIGNVVPFKVESKVGTNWGLMAA